MHRILFLFCLAVACNNSQHPSTKATPVSIGDSVPKDDISALRNVSTDSAIVYVRHVYQQINTMPLRSQHFNWEAENCGEGTATYYLTLNNEIAKVVEAGAIGDGSWTTAYYYQDGVFLFSLETNIGGPAMGPVDTFTIRKYAYGYKVIRTMRDDTYTTPTDRVLTAASKEYRILEAYKNKNFGAAFCN